jgi:hypothetical protein
MLVKGMRLLTPRDVIKDGQQQQQQQPPPPPKPPLERLADSSLARRITESDNQESFLDFSSAPAPRRVAWADEEVVPIERVAPAATQTPHVAAAIGMIVTPTPINTSDDGDNCQCVLVVTDVVAHSPAAAAGLAPGDIITHVDGQLVTTGDEVALLVAGPEGSCVEISGFRDNKIVTFCVTRRAMWVAHPPRPTLPSTHPIPPSTSRATSPIPFSRDDNPGIAALKSSLQEACITWQEDVRQIHRHYEALLTPLCQHVHVDPVSAAVVSLHGCTDLSSLADLLNVTRMAQHAASGVDDEFIAK